jgi:ankyrin repeat protein
MTRKEDIISYWYEHFNNQISLNRRLLVLTEKDKKFLEKNKGIISILETARGLPIEYSIDNVLVDYFWKDYIVKEMEENGNLNLLAIIQLKMDSELIEAIEYKFDLEITGNYNEFMENYRKTYYTKQCIAYHSEDPETCLSGAARNGNYEVLELALRNGAKNYTEGIITAVYNGKTDMANFIIDLAGENLKPNSINQIFLAAASTGDKEIIDLMLKKGADDFFAAISEALGNHIEIAKYLTNRAGEKLTEANITNLFINSANIVKPEMIDFFIEKGADLDYLVEAISEAILGENIETARYLINLDNNILTKEQINEVFVDSVSLKDNEIFNLLLDKGADDYGLALIRALEFGDVEKTKVLFGFFNNDEDVLNAMNQADDYDDD